MQEKVYIIPSNFLESGYVFGGLFKLRNLIEGGVLAIIAAGPLRNLPIQDFAAKVSVILCVAIPFLIIGITGISGDPLSVFLRHVWAWKKSKRVMLFNNATVCLAEKPVDYIMSQETPRDKMIQAVDKLKSSRKPKERPVLIEGEDFEFAEDKKMQVLVHTSNEQDKTKVVPEPVVFKVEQPEQESAQRAEPTEDKSVEASAQIDGSEEVEEVGAPAIASCYIDEALEEQIDDAADIAELIQSADEIDSEEVTGVG